MIHIYPENYARFYDLIYHQLRDDVDLAYFQNVIQKTKGKILEVGVGTGRLFLNALHQGADIYGLDISPSMIDILRKKMDEDQSERISLQNILDFSFDFKFDLVVAPFRVMMHVLDKEEQIKALNNVYEHLKPNGRFIFDVFVPDLKQLIHGIDNYTDFEEEYEPGKKIKRIISTKPDLIQQLIHVTFHLQWDEDDGPKSEEWKVPLRFYFRYELEHLIERSKFKDYTIHGDYEGTELHEQSRDFLVTCKHD